VSSGGEGDGYVVAAAVEAMGDECVDGVGYGHHVCAGVVEVQFGHRLAVAGDDRELRGLSEKNRTDLMSSGSAIGVIAS